MPERIEPLADRMTPQARAALRAVLVDHTIEIVSCRFFKNAAPWNVPQRTCPDSFFLFPTQGRVRVAMNGGVRELSPGSYLMLPEGRHHALAIGKGVKSLHQISLHCQIHDRWNRPLLARFTTAFGRLTPPTPWIDALKDLAHLSASGSTLRQAHGETLVRSLLLDRLRSEKRFVTASSDGDPRIERVLQLIDERLGSPLLSVEGLADECELSPAQLRKLFRRDTGTGPKEYVTRTRLRRAVRLLRDPARRVKQIAFECGFSSDHYFHLVFREAFGCTPSEYRETRAV